MRRSLVVALVLMATGACGINAEESVHRVDADRVPFGLLDAAPDPTSTTTTVRQGSVLPIFLIEGDRLVQVMRAAPRDDLGIHVDTLLAGPDDAEADAGLRSAWSSVDLVRGVALDGGIASVDLAPTFGELPGQEQVLALAQLVFTLTARPGIGRVTFTVEGAPVDVPRADGALTRDSLARDAYQALLRP